MTKVCVLMLDLISVRVQSEREVEPQKPCSVLLAAVPTPVAIPKAAKHISRFMTVLPQSAATIRSRCISGMSPVIELVSFVSRQARDAGLVAYHLGKTAMSWDACCGA